MARHRTRKGEIAAEQIRLAQPDRSGAGPHQKTLLDIAAKRGLLNTAERDGKAESVDDVDGPLVGRLGDSVMLSISLTMLHMTFDVLVQNQYAVDIEWPATCERGLQAFAVFFILMYCLHPHPEPSSLIPNILPAYRHLLSQTLFMAGSVAAGCYLIYITNEHTYYAVMKRAPALGCLWIWSVIELELLPAVGSLGLSAAYLLWNGYSYK